MLAFAGLVVWYIFNIQMVDGARWRALSDSLTLKYRVIKAVRGNIYADDGTILATSVPRYEIRMDLTVLPDDTFNFYIPKLSFLYSEKFKDKTYQEYLLAFKDAKVDAKKNRYFFLKNKLSFLDIKEIKNWPLYKKGRYKSGLIIEEENYRVRPFKNLLTRTIGYTTNGKETQRVGLEGYFNEALAGVTGRRLLQKISGGYRPVNDNNELEPVAGKDIYTTIDINIQDIVNDALQCGLLKHKAQFGCAILMEVKTGEIKAIANLTLSKIGTYEETFNYAIRESFEPGSTFKLLSALLLLEKNKIGTNDSVMINYGVCNINGKPMKDAEKSNFKSKSFSYAFEHSSNVGISTTVLKAFKDNPSEFTDYLKELKLDKPLGIELYGEGIPVIKSPRNKHWSKISLPWMSIGYEVQITPLQLLTVYNGVANDGEMLKPFLVKAIGQKGDIEKTFKPITIHEKIASKSTITKIKAMLRGVVDSGTARIINNSRVHIAGKTGTARISNGKGYHEDAYNSSFAGYFPAEEPKYSIIVVVNRPTEGGYFGGTVAGPIVKQIAEKVMGIQQINGSELSDSLTDPGTLPFLISGKNSRSSEFLDKFTSYDYNDNGASFDWIIAKKDSIGSYNFSVVNQNPDLVPDLIGMGLRDAIYCAENRKLKVRYIGKGRIYWQSIPQGSKIDKGSSIIVKLKI